MSLELPAWMAPAEAGVRTAVARGADQAEVFATRMREARVDFRKNDLHHAATAEETVFGIRVFRGGAPGFATVNTTFGIGQACEEALALTAAAPADPRNGLATPAPVEALPESWDPDVAALEVGDLVDLGVRLLDRVRGQDARVVVDSGEVRARVVERGIVTSTGVRLADKATAAGGQFFGMAVDGDEVGSFDHDGHTVRRRRELEVELGRAADRFVIKTLAALGARPGESFRGTVILSPEVVRDFVLANLMAVVEGRSVRTGKSPFCGRLGELVASPSLDLRDEPRRPGATASQAFDREGTPTRPWTILEDGVLRGFLYDVYEARVAGHPPSGHARGGASSQPTIGPTNLVLRQGDVPFARLCSEPARAVLVSRFSGSCNPVTGEFSGVAKGGFLLRRGERIPIRETLIAGNLYQALRNVSGVSEERRNIEGSALVPALRLEDISVTAG